MLRVPITRHYYDGLINERLACQQYMSMIKVVCIYYILILYSDIYTYLKYIFNKQIN